MIWSCREKSTAAQVRKARLTKTTFYVSLNKLLIFPKNWFLRYSTVASFDQGGKQPPSEKALDAIYQVQK